MKDDSEEKYLTDRIEYNANKQQHQQQVVYSNYEDEDEDDKSPNTQYQNHYNSKIERETSATSA
jgi:hypothetical protein